MDISITDSLFLTSALAFLMIGYIQRRNSIISVTRKFAADHNKGNHRFKQDKQMLLHRERLSLFTGMLIMSALGTLFSCAAALCIVLQRASTAKVAFIIAVAMGMLGLVQSIRESLLSNKAVYMEVDNTVSKEDPYYKTSGP